MQFYVVHPPWHLLQAKPTPNYAKHLHMSTPTISEAVVADTEPMSGPASAQKGARRAPRMGTIHTIASRLYHHARKHTGVGIVCSVAYFDP